MTPEQSYNLYHALKLHFDTKYDFIKYKGKLSRPTKPSNHALRFAAKLEKKYKYEYFNFLLANFSSPANKNLFALVDEQAEMVYNEWRKRIERMRYTFEQDMRYLEEKESDFKALFTSEDDWGEPPLLVEVAYKNISFETLVILYKILPLQRKWEDVQNPLWTVLEKKIQNYAPFLDIEKPAYIKIIKEIFNI